VFDSVRTTLTSASFASRTMSDGGTLSIPCTSPASSAAMRDGLLGMIRSVAFPHAGFAPQ
jgi:hypothetical protein